ncbi:MAG: amino acid adenylation domain-containing protein [Lachnospiraceae bacterium]|nr:amino acid adenylation domain-containing protein [Lachnospiraceae bacterium]
MNKNVLSWLEEAAERYPDKIAYSDSCDEISFSEVLKKAKAIGSALTERIDSKEAVAVMMGRSVYTIAAMLGVVYSGHIYAPIDASLPSERIHNILDTLKPSAILTDEESYDAACLYGDIAKCDVIKREDIQSGACDDARLDKIRSNMAETDPLYIIFTSGSSGRPKGVLTSHHSLMCYIDAYSDMMGITSDDVMGCQSPLDYIAAIRDIYVPLKTGASDHLIPKEYFMQPDELFGLLNKKKITAIGWSASALTVLVQLGAFSDIGLDTLKKICFSGSVIGGKVLRKWQDNLPDADFVNQYGPTEATASCTYYRIDHPVEADEMIPIGVPYENYKVFLLKDDNTEALDGEEGEICVAGPILALGYYNDPERTKSAFTINPLVSAFEERMYRTGDIGKYRSDGCLEFHGRKDRQVKHMGHRVELDEIEVAAGSTDGVGECAAVYNADKETLWLFYSGDAEKRELVLKLREKLPGFMIPRKIKQLDELPKLPNGKTDFGSLKSLAGL